MSRKETRFTNYLVHCEGVAEDFVDEYIENLLTENIMEAVIPDYHEWVNSFDGKLHEWIDQEVNLFEAVDILGQCINEETDWGLWEGIQQPEKQIGVKAFFSYTNDLIYHFIPIELFDRLEKVSELNSIRIDNYQDEISELEEGTGEYELLDEEISDLMAYVDNIEQFINEELKPFLK